MLQTELIRFQQGVMVLSRHAAVVEIEILSATLNIDVDSEGGEIEQTPLSMTVSKITLLNSSCCSRHAVLTFRNRQAWSDIVGPSHAVRTECSS